MMQDVLGCPNCLRNAHGHCFVAGAIPPPLHSTLQNGLELRLLELLQLQSPKVKFLASPSDCLVNQKGVPFYFFAPKVRDHGGIWDAYGEMV